MKRPLELSCILFLLAGLLIGGIFPMPWDSLSQPVGSGTMTHPPASSGTAASDISSTAFETLDSTDNFALLNTACYVVDCLRHEDFAAVSTVVHPERGVTFTPYSTVDFETDQTFTPAQIRNLAEDQTVYTWGFVDGRGSLINMTMSQYFEEYVFNVDYSQAPRIAVDEIVLSGNALENLTEAYPGCRFVDFCFPGLDAVNEGMDWCSLKLVFQPGDTRWYLVGVIHGQWTI